MINCKIGNEWDSFIEEEISKEYFKNLISYINNEYQEKNVYPKETDIFNAFKLTDINNVKVVILGQDPYHGAGEAHGLSFSVKEGIKLPPSLKNIYKEIQAEYGYEIPIHGCLEQWARQGVLLINSVLTVIEDKPNSHKGIGWEIFTDNVISKLNQNNKPIVFMLWGKYAETKKDLITNPSHLVLIAPHPSPFSARKGFFGCNHFKIANEFLEKHYDEIIDWKI